MREYVRLLKPAPAPLPRSRRHRFWTRIGQPFALGNSVVTVMRDIVDGEAKVPHLELHCATDPTLTGRASLCALLVDGFPGASCVPRAIRVYRDGDMSLLWELREDVEGALLGVAA